MIIWGSRSKASTKESGRFYCPHCQGHRQYELKHSKQYFTLYFVRTFPIQDHGEYVECTSCKTTYDKKILDYDPEKEAEEYKAVYLLLILDLLIKLAITKNSIENLDISKIENAYLQATQISLDKDLLMNAYHRVRNSEKTYIQIANELSTIANEFGKEAILRASIKIISEDKTVTKNELEMLFDLSESLQIPRAYVRGIFIEEEIICK